MDFNRMERHYQLANQPVVQTPMALNGVQPVGWMPANFRNDIQPAEVGETDVYDLFHGHNGMTVSPTTLTQQYTRADNYQAIMQAVRDDIHRQTKILIPDQSVMDVIGVMHKLYMMLCGFYWGHTGVTLQELNQATVDYLVELGVRNIRGEQANARQYSVEFPQAPVYSTPMLLPDTMRANRDFQHPHM